jgi:hypothetical protein
MQTRTVCGGGGQSSSSQASPLSITAPCPVPTGLVGDGGSEKLAHLARGFTPRNQPRRYPEPEVNNVAANRWVVIRM